MDSEAEAQGADRVVMTDYDRPRASTEHMLTQAHQFLQIARLRRSIRSFSERPVSGQVIETCIRAAGTAPSGANQQPWHFVAVGDFETKRRIRLAAEVEEQAFYGGRAPDEWLRAVRPLGTNAEKPFLEIAPWLIAIFAESYGSETGTRTTKNYYVSESVGIATGILISALNHAGLGTLTHTPSPMKFLNAILGRPDNERPFLLLVVGFPSEHCQVPKLTKKPLSEIATFVE